LWADRYARHRRASRAALIEAQLARAALERDRDAGRLVEIGVVRRRPEHWSDRNTENLLQQVGVSACAQRFDERHQRAAEQAGLLPRGDDDAIRLRGAAQTIRSGAAWRDRRFELIEPVRRHTGCDV